MAGWTSPRVRVRVLLAMPLLGIIGAAAPTAQSRGRPVDASAFRATTLPPGLRRRLGELLDPATPARWSAAWDLAARRGTVLAPALLRACAREGRRESRWLLLVTSGVAARWRLIGTARPDRLRDPSISERERFLTLVGIASGPVLPGPPPSDLDAVIGNRQRPRALWAAALMARSRFATSTELPERFLRRPGWWRDAGLACGALACGAPFEEPLRGHWESAGRDPEERALVWRAWLLGPAQGRAERLDDPARDRLALRILEDRTAAAALRVAAALRLGRTARGATLADERLAGLEDAEACAFAAWPPGRAVASRRGWTGPEPSRRLPVESRRRLGLAWAASRSVDEVLARAERWQGDREVAGVVLLDLARRVFLGERAGRVESVPGGLDEAAWLHLALGSPTKSDPTFTDERLARAYRLARGGRLRGAAAAAELDRALWRRGAHPGRLLHEARMDLVMDVLVAGSGYARARLGLDRRPRYLPDGFPADDAVFEVAVELLVWVRRAAPFGPER